MMGAVPRVLAGALLVALAATPAHAICGRKSCVVGSAPAIGGYDPFAGIGGMVDLMLGLGELAGAHQQATAARQAQALQQKGEALFNDGDYVAAVATLEQAAHANPRSAAIKASLERARRALADVRDQETARRQADTAAIQRRISGAIGELIAGIEREMGPAAVRPDAIDFMAPGGTSFFGTGGGAGAPPPPAPRAPPGSAGQLDFALPNEPLFQKGAPGSPPVRLGERQLATPPRVPPSAGSPSPPGGAATGGLVEPDPIVYRSAGFVPWAVRTFAGAGTTGAVERSLADATIPAPALPWEGRRPMNPAGAGTRNDLRARELANLAFDRAGIANYAETEQLLAAAQRLAPDDDRMFRALMYIRDQRARPPQAPRATAEIAKTMAVGFAERGKREMGRGNFQAAADAFTDAVGQDPSAPEYRRWEIQAAVGAILASAQ